ncbi:MAG: MarR family transcriptional regulator, partial [Clostridia bacterium]
NENRSFHILFAHVSRLYFNVMMREVEDMNIHPGQVPLLLFLTQNGVKRDLGKSQKEIADELLVKPPTITVMLQRMESSGFVDKKQDIEDQRKTKIFVTEKGFLTTKKLISAIEKAENLTFKNFTKEEKILMNRFLFQIKENLFESGKDDAKSFKCHPPILN